MNDGANPASGIYDLRFAIYDSDTGSGAVGAAQTNSAVGVSNGLFTVMLNFGSGVFTGPDRWLEIGVRPNGGDFTTLTPRQQITATPYALRALTAGSVPAGTITSTMLAPGSASQRLGLPGAGRPLARMARCGRRRDLPGDESPFALEHE